MHILLQAGVPLVLHSGLYDLLYLYQNFIDEVPSEMQTFLEDLHAFCSNNSKTNYKKTKTVSRFRLLDTKLVFRNNFDFLKEFCQFENPQGLAGFQSATALSAFVTNLPKEKQQRLKNIYPCFEQSANQFVAHEAEADATMTGKLLFHMLAAKKATKDPTAVTVDWREELFLLFQEHGNLLYLAYNNNTFCLERSVEKRKHTKSTSNNSCFVLEVGKQIGPIEKTLAYLKDQKIEVYDLTFVENLVFVETKQEVEMKDLANVLVPQFGEEAKPLEYSNYLIKNYLI